MSKNRVKRIGLTYDLRSQHRLRPGDPPDSNAEFDHPATIKSITTALESGGYEVIRLGNVYNLLNNLNSLKVDIVFNICEGMYGRNRESQVPMLLELKGIPFVGADALSIGITLDKIITKKILISHGIPTPDYIFIDNANSINGFSLNFPLIIKPRFEGSSKGLNDDSVVNNRRELIRQARWLINTYKQPALVEEFISGQEFTVAIIGNKNPRVFPSVQIKIDGNLKLNNLFYTFARIHSNSIEYICPSPISKKLESQISELALATYKATECRDFGRVDIRVDKRLKPYVLEINPLPSLSTKDVFFFIGEYLKVGYNRMVLYILEAAIERYGL